MNHQDVHEKMKNPFEAPTGETQDPAKTALAPMELTINGMDLAWLSKVQDDYVNQALYLCRDKLSEPRLSLGQICQAIGALFRGGKKPCARTIQRWTLHHGFPYSREFQTGRRIYFLSEVIDWYQANYQHVSTVADAAANAKACTMRDEGAFGRRRHVRSYPLAS